MLQFGCQPQMLALVDIPPEGPCPQNSYVTILDQLVDDLAIS